jgi:hypothetical protein
MFFWSWVLLAFCAPGAAAAAHETVEVRWRDTACRSASQVRSAALDASGFRLNSILLGLDTTLV